MSRVMPRLELVTVLLEAHLWKCSICSAASGFSFLTTSTSQLLIKDLSTLPETAADV